MQVLQELYVNLIRKETPPEQAVAFVSDYLAWHVITNDGPLLLRGIAESTRWKISLWDGLIIAAAKSAGANEVWSEDLSDGQDYGGVHVTNPLQPLHPEH